jgi:ribonucleoside-triphosphate reductase
VSTRFHLPYFTLTPTFSVCPSHGYLIGEQAICEDCGQETEIYSRVVGYLRPVKQWNNGKQAEFAIRNTFDLNTQEMKPCNLQVPKPSIHYAADYAEPLPLAAAVGL